MEDENISLISSTTIFFLNITSSLLEKHPLRSQNKLLCYLCVRTKYSLANFDYNMLDITENVPALYFSQPEEPYKSFLE